MKKIIKKKRKISFFERIFRFKDQVDRFANIGTQEAMDLPPGSHFFSCDAKCRVYMIEEGNKIRMQYILESGRRRLVIPYDCFVTVQCAQDTSWQFDVSAAAEVVDQTRIEVPLADQHSNKAHTDLRYMIDRMMRGNSPPKRPEPVEETEEDRKNFDTGEEHPYTRYEQRAYDEDNPPSEQPAPGAPAPGVSTSPGAPAPTPASGLQAPNANGS